MELTRTEENKNRKIAAGVTLLSFAALVLFLIFKNIVSTEPLFPAAVPNEVSIGFSNGSGNQNGGKTAAAAPVKKQEESPAQKLAADPNQEIIKVKTGLEEITDRFKNTNSQNISQNQNSEVAPPGITEEKGTPTEPKNTNGEEGFAFNLSKRNIISAPKFASDTKEEGKIVVEIVVDKEGNVIEANPNGRGTTTSSAVLKSKARQMAIATKFSADPKTEEQRGTITILFTYN